MTSTAEGKKSMGGAACKRLSTRHSMGGVPEIFVMIFKKLAIVTIGIVAPPPYKIIMTLYCSHETNMY